MRFVEILIGRSSFTKILPVSPHPPRLYPNIPTHPYTPKGPPPARRQPLGPMGLAPWAQALWGTGVGGDIGV